MNKEVFITMPLCTGSKNCAGAVVCAPLAGTHQVPEGALADGIKCCHPSALPPWLDCTSRHANATKQGYTFLS